MGYQYQFFHLKTQQPLVNNHVSVSVLIYLRHIMRQKKRLHLQSLKPLRRTDLVPWTNIIHGTGKRYIKKQINLESWGSGGSCLHITWFRQYDNSKTCPVRDFQQWFRIAFPLYCYRKWVDFVAFIRFARNV